jgi:hypothetical protein
MVVMMLRDGASIRALKMQQQRVQLHHASFSGMTEEITSA